MGLFGKRRSTENKTSYFELTPRANYEYSKNENGLADVHVLKFKNNFARKYINHRMQYPYIKANLDELGTAVWIRIDGQRKVADIINSVKNTASDDTEQLELRITKFLTQLYNAGFISFKELKKGRKHG